MAVREISASFEAVCDCCRTVEPMKSNGRPAHWINLNILRDAYDFQGAAVADGSVKLLLCVPCSDAAVKAVNLAFDERRATLEGKGG